MRQFISVNRRLTMGIDVDARKNHVVVRDDTTGDILDSRRFPTTSDNWSRYLDLFPGCNIRAYYEAGCTGFVLYRYLRSMGVECKVVPASEVPVEANASRRKSDSTDAARISQVGWIPPHSFVRIPTPEEEADRQLTRTREQFRKDRTRIKDRIKKFLLYYGIALPEWYKGAWTIRFNDWLRSFETGNTNTRQCLDLLLNELDSINQLITDVEDGIRKLSRTDRYLVNYARLTSIPGVGLITAMTFLTEVFRPEEFKTSREVACHIGFTPGEWSSGQSTRRGHITRWGCGHLRRMLVEASWQWIRFDRDAGRCYAQICQRRQSKIAIVAMARRLAISMWAVVVKQEQYRYHWAA